MRKRLWIVALLSLILSIGAFSTVNASPGGERGGPDDPNCEDMQDNDGDDLVDEDDPDCRKPGCLPSDQTPNKCFEENDDSQPPHVPQCRDGQDNDGDGKTDHPADPGCSNPNDDDESDDPHVPQCSDGQDNDGDGKTDLDDPGCSGPDDDDESDDPHVPQCSDGQDNDGDGKTDHPADPGCSNPNDDDESDDPHVPQCSDGIDNDGDGKTDLDDPGCSGPDDDDETDPAAENHCAVPPDHSLLALLFDNGAPVPPEYHDTLGQMLYDGLLVNIGSPLFEDPEHDGALSGALGEAAHGQEPPVSSVLFEAACLVDTPFDGEALPGDL